MKRKGKEKKRKEKRRKKREKKKEKGKKGKKEKLTPFSINSTRSQILYQAAQVC